jgi:ribosomal protein L23
MATKKTTTKEVAKVEKTKAKNSEVKSAILGKPVITEKAAKASSSNTYAFNVAVGATKSEIAKAFVAQYKHKPVRVNIINKRAKSYFKRGVLGFGKKGKKAYITLPKGKTIEVI